MAHVINLARRPSSGAPMETVPTLSMRPSDGIDGDYHRRGKRQVTVLFVDAWEAACQEVNAELDWTTRRANILVSGMSLAECKGTILRLGSCELEITGETTPCSLMEAAQPGLRGALATDWRGGVTCKVVKEGVVAVGDTVKHVVAEMA